MECQLRLFSQLFDKNHSPTILIQHGQTRTVAELFLVAEQCVKGVFNLICLGSCTIENLLLIMFRMRNYEQLGLSKRLQFNNRVHVSKAKLK